MHEFLSGVGAFTILIVGGGWVMAQFENRRHREDFQRELRYLDGKRTTDPSNVEQYDEEIRALILRGPRKSKLFK